MFFYVSPGYNDIERYYYKYRNKIDAVCELHLYVSSNCIDDQSALSNQEMSRNNAIAASLKICQLATSDCTVNRLNTCTQLVFDFAFHQIAIYILKIIKFI